MIETNGYTFKKLFLITISFVTPFSLLESFLALLNIQPVTFDGTPRIGFIGFIIPICLIPLWGLSCGGLSWVILNVGAFFYNKTQGLFKK